MRGVHEWSSEKAKTVTNYHNLRKEYQWKEGAPVRPKKSEKPSKPDNHHKRKCPVEYCMFVGIKLGRHLASKHGMKAGTDLYYEALSIAVRHGAIKTSGPRNASISNVENHEDEIFDEPPVEEEERDDQMEAETLETRSGNFEEPVLDDSSIREQEIEDTMKIFLHHLLTHEGGKRDQKSSLQVVKEVRTVIESLGKNLVNLFNHVKLRDDFFVNFLEKKCTPATCKHYLQSLITFFDFLICEPASQNTIRFHPSKDDCVSMKLRLTKWRKSYNKATDERRWEIEEEESEALITPEQVKIFSEGSFSREVVKLFGRLVDDQSFRPSVNEFTTMRNYVIATIALSNGHRSGVIANLTMEEYSKHTINEERETVTIRVRNHKTFRQHGYALICLPIQKFQYFKIYVEKVRPVFPSSSQNVFLSFKGNPLASGAVSDQIDSIWKQSGVYGDSQPPKKKLGTTVIRRAVTSQIHHDDRQNIQNVADLLAHSVSTATKTYRRKRMEETAAAATKAITNAFKTGSTITKPPAEKTL